jgi:hypothetical protein
MKLILLTYQQVSQRRYVAVTLNRPNNRFAYCRLYNKFTASYCPFQILWITWHGHFTATQGRVRNLASLTRISDISLEYNENAGGITVFGSLGLTELRVSRYLVSLFFSFYKQGSVHVIMLLYLSLKVHLEHALTVQSIMF